MTDFRIIRPSELSEMLGVSVQTIWRMEKRGELPERVKISKRSIGWRSDEISEFVNSKKVNMAEPIG
jgi:predicted DNA-binding transcriptional regulator AlpA